MLKIHKKNMETNSYCEFRDKESQTEISSGVCFILIVCSYWSKQFSILQPAISLPSPENSFTSQHSSSSDETLNSNDSIKILYECEHNERPVENYGSILNLQKIRKKRYQIKEDGRQKERRRSVHYSDDVTLKPLLE